jgi:hypothetical protein
MANMRTEIARVKHNNTNRMAIAKEFAKLDIFRNYRLGEIIETMRVYELDGNLEITDTEAVLYHNFY